MFIIIVKSHNHIHEFNLEGNYKQPNSLFTKTMANFSTGLLLAGIKICSSIIYSKCISSPAALFFGSTKLVSCNRCSLFLALPGICPFIYNPVYRLCNSTFVCLSTLLLSFHKCSKFEFKNCTKM